jgi:hypothetical protein
MIARNDAPNDRLQPDLQSVVALDTFDFSWVKPREQDFCITRSGGGLCASTGFADSNERREGTGSPKSAVLGTAFQRMTTTNEGVRE